MRSTDCALRSTDGEFVRGLSTEVRPTTDLHLLDSERMTGNTKVSLKSPSLSAKQETPLVLPHLRVLNKRDPGRRRQRGRGSEGAGSGIGKMRGSS
jgi:hypothetical protein